MTEPCAIVCTADAVGAKLARPEQQVVAILGDYAFGAACMEVETCIRWNIPVVIVLSNNAGIAAHSIQDRSFSEGAPPVRHSESLLGFLRRQTSSLRLYVFTSLRKEAVALVRTQIAALTPEVGYEKMVEMVGGYSELVIPPHPHPRIL